MNRLPAFCDECGEKFYPSKLGLVLCPGCAGSIRPKERPLFKHGIGGAKFRPWEVQELILEQARKKRPKAADFGAINYAAQ